MSITKAKITGKVVRIFLKTPDDFRALTKSLDARASPLTGEKLTHAVIRGLPMNTPTEDISVQLKEHDLDMDELCQLTFRRNKKKMPLFVVKTVY